MNAPAPQHDPAPRRATVIVAERPVPKDDRPLGEKVREAVEDGLFRLRRLVEESWEDFRRQDRFFHRKAAIFVAWLLVSAFSFHIATSGPSDPSANRLRAYVAMTHTSMSWALLVHNRSDEPWTGVRVILDGSWVHERPTIGPDEKVVLSPTQFLNAAGMQAPLDLAVVEVRVETDDGSATPPLVH